MSIELDRARIAEIVEAIADRLPGEFLLIGGALVALWIEPRRVTEDIDIIGFDGDSRQRLALMDLAHDLGLPIEAVNSPARSAELGCSQRSRVTRATTASAANASSACARRSSPDDPRQRKWAVPRVWHT